MRTIRGQGSEWAKEPTTFALRVRDALALDPAVPLLTCDARDRASTIATLTELVGHTLSLAVLSGPRELAGSVPNA